MCFTVVIMIAKLVLQLAGIENAFAHLLFPFHVFDVASNYALFSLIIYMRGAPPQPSRKPNRAPSPTKPQAQSNHKPNRAASPTEPKSRVQH